MTTKEERMQQKLAIVVGLGALGSFAWMYQKRIRDWWSAKFASGDPVVGPPEPAGDPVVGPAYPYLSKWTHNDRAALVNANAVLGLDPALGAIAGVIQHESGGDPTAPHKAEGTPRGGLIQLTQGARLPGFDSESKVWAVRDMSIPDQFEQVIIPFYRRMHLASDTTAVLLMRKNFLPGVASKPDSFVLGVKDGATGPNGETVDTKLIEDQHLTLGQIYKANPGFAHGKDYFTWADADADAIKTEKQAKGQVITLSGKIQSVSA